MKKYTFPPDAIYALGKRKEHATKAIRTCEEVLKDASLYGSNAVLVTQISKMLDLLTDYRKKLDLP
jgi:hypothetical protein